MAFDLLEKHFRENNIPFTAIAMKGEEFKFFNTSDVEQLELIEVIFNGLKRDKFDNIDTLMDTIVFYACEVCESIYPTNFDDEYDILYKHIVSSAVYSAMKNGWDYILVIPINSSVENFRSECQIHLSNSDNMKSMIASIIRSLCSEHPSKSFNFITDLITNYSEE